MNIYFYFPRKKTSSGLWRSIIFKKSGQHCKRLTVLTFAWATGNVGIICMRQHHIHLYCSDNKSLLRTVVRKWCDKITWSLVFLELHSGLKQQLWSVSGHLDWLCSWQLQEEINIFRFSRSVQLNMLFCCQMHRLFTTLVSKSFRVVTQILKWDPS